MENELLLQILSEIKEMKQDMQVLKQDVQVLKQDVQVLKQDVQVLKQDVEQIKVKLATQEKAIEDLLDYSIAIDKTASDTHKELKSFQKRVYALETITSDNWTDIVHLRGLLAK